MTASSDDFRGEEARARLGVVTNDFPPRVGGIQTYILSLLQGLDPAEVVVVAPTTEGAAACDGAFDFEVVRVGASAGALLPIRATAKRVATLLRSRGVDMVALTSMVPLGPLGRSVSRLLDVPLLVWHHGAELSSLARLPGGAALLRRVASVPTVHFVVSRWTESIAARVFGRAADIRLMRFGIDANRFCPAGGTQAAKRMIRRRLGIEGEAADPLILTVGRLIKRKGNDTLLSAMIALRSRYPGSSLVIAGSGPDSRRLEGLVREARIGKAVQFLGDVDTEDLPDLYRCADIFAAPIRTRFFGFEGEGLGITLVEAAACGLPVVAGRSGGTPEAVADGVSGFLVDGADCYEVAGALGKLAGDPALRSSMGTRGRTFVVSEFSRSRMVEIFRRAARDVVGSRRACRPAS